MTGNSVPWAGTAANTAKRDKREFTIRRRVGPAGNVLSIILSREVGFDIGWRC